MFPKQMKTTSKRRILALGLGVVLAAVPVAALEWWMRVQEGSSAFVLALDEPGRKYFLRNVDEHGSLNSEGFNDREWSRERTEGVLRVVLGGDSVSFGSGLLQTELYPRVAEKILLERGLPVEIFNFSIYGYDVEQVSATLRARAWAYQPDLVVYAAYTNDHQPSEFLYVGDDKWPVFVGTTVEDDISDGLADLWLGATRVSAIARRLLGARAANKRADRNRERSDEVWETFFDPHLKEMANQSAARGVPLVVYGLLPHVMARPERCGDGVRPARFCSVTQQRARRIHQAAHALGLGYFSALDALKDGDQPHYFREGVPHDVHHPNPDGHVRLAHGLADLIWRWHSGDDLLESPGDSENGGRPAMRIRQKTEPQNKGESRRNRRRVRELRALAEQEAQNASTPEEPETQ